MVPTLQSRPPRRVKPTTGGRFVEWLLCRLGIGVHFSERLQLEEHFDPDRYLQTAEYWSSSLEPPETTGIDPADEVAWQPGNADDFDGSPGPLREETSFRHSHWRKRRKLTHEALIRTGVGCRRCDRFARCGGNAWVQHSAMRNSYRLSVDVCRDRFCGPCQMARAARIIRRLETWIDAGGCRFITLTMRHSNTPLKAQIDRMYAAFATLRKRREFRDSVTGGIAICEVKLSKGGSWHPHLHAIISGRFLEQKTLSRMWHEVTGDSSIVDIRAVKSGCVAQYVSKYLSKPADGEVYKQKGMLDEMLRALQGRRMVLPWGLARECGQGDDEEDRALTNDWQNVKMLVSFIDAARAGDEGSARVLQALFRRREKWKDEPS